MRPLKLTMTGFGPYKELTSIDMESLGRGGLYLITGDTGSGKTYIFDAITYALYGEMSGSGRDAKTARSQYCTGAEATEVTLDFEYHGKRYSVTRNPEYMRPKKSGEGFTKQTADACLSGPDGIIAAGSSRVSAEIKQILGIDREQFCNIVMIAQGEFRKVLNAGTDERQKLFRKIFDTLPYSRLTDELRELSRASQTEYDEKVRGTELNLSSVECSFDEGLADKLAEMKENVSADAGVSDIIGLLSEIEESAVRHSSDISTGLAAAEEELRKHSNTIALAQDHRKNVLSLEAAQNAVAVLAEEIEAAKAEYDRALESRPVIDSLISESAFIESNLDSYDRLDSLNREISRLKKETSSKTAALEALRKERELTRASVEELESEYESIRYSGEKLIKVNNSIEKSANRIDVLKALIGEIDRADDCRDVLTALQKELEPLIEDEERLDAEHSRLLAAFMREQAGILASGLAEGEPCPVCGSVHHPDPAFAASDAPSADSVEKAEQAAKAARSRASQKLSEVQKAKGNLNALMISVTAESLRETGTDDTALAREAAEDQITKLDEEAIALKLDAAGLKTESERAAELEEKIPEMKKDLEASLSKAHEAEKEIASLSASLTALMERRDELKTGLSYESKSGAQKRISEISAEVKDLKDRIERCRQDLAEAESDMQSNDTKIAELKKVVEGYTPVDEERAIEGKAAAEAEKLKLTDLGTSVSIELASVRQALSAIRKNADDIEMIRKEHQKIDSLFRTASGSLTGKERISLESYVQSFYFDRIIRRANVRLRMMSDGQYEFVRSGGAADKRHQSGLDLDVLDHYNGSERPVNSLSGGETFMASLSLALGLSDEVQASSGGIRLDTMFVDEGFGSLDPETLEKAIRTLTELSDEDRLVGIISHVDVLRDRIEKQIIVSKEKDRGSTAVVVC